MRQAELARITGAPVTRDGRVGSRKGTPDALIQNLRGTVSASYTAKVVSCIRPYIAYQVPANLRRGEHVAEYRISLLPDGSKASAPVKLKSSGLAAYDRAVERAIGRCDPFPRPSGGAQIPRTMQIRFDPVDNN